MIAARYRVPEPPGPEPEAAAAVHNEAVQTDNGVMANAATVNEATAVAVSKAREL